MPVETLVFLIIYGALGMEFLHVHLMRHQALKTWRASLGGGYDHGQRRFATILELDRARLPEAAAKKLAASRRSLFICFLILAPTLIIQLMFFTFPTQPPL